MSVIRHLHFWRTQFRETMRNAGVRGLGSRLSKTLEVGRQIFANWRMHRRDMGKDFVEPECQEKATVILLNWVRPWNLQIIVDRLLKAKFIERIIVVNNCADYAMDKFLKSDDSRVIVNNQNKNAGVAIRYQIAKQYRSGFYLTIDDDVFLSAKQVWGLFRAVVDDPDCPHGIQGSIHNGSESTPEDPWPFHRAIRRQEATVDILNVAYSFTHEHLLAFHRLAKKVGVEDTSKMFNCEDIILSRTGRKKPMIHDLGKTWRCATSSTEGIALHTTRKDFYGERWKMFCDVRRVTETPEYTA